MQFGFNNPFNEQLEFFRQKLNLPTEKWDDIMREAHDRAFVVAGAADADLLQDLRNAIDKAISQGKGIEEFRRDFKQIVKTRGWTGWTGEGSKGGEAWRTRVIYQTNMTTSYAAGRWKQLTDPEYLKLRPNWKYRHNDSVQHPRPEHLLWDGVVLPANHPAWLTHFAPNGWGCECWIEAARNGEKVTDPPYGWNKINPATGAPFGIDRGFDYAPGASIKPQLRKIVDEKKQRLDPELAEALESKVAQVLQTSVYDIFTLPRSGIAKEASKIALAEIDKLHSAGNLPKLPIVNSRSQSFQGQYSYRYIGSPVDIKVSTASVNPELTLAHEIGHFIDNQAFTPGKYGSLSNPLFKKWKEAVDKSNATRVLQQELKESKSRISSKRVEYYLQTVEQWARAYSQWVAVRSQNQVMLDQVSRIISKTEYKVYAASQWTDEDFAPIADAIDEIFKELGWLK
jgi:hypothetical protein